MDEYQQFQQLQQQGQQPQAQPQAQGLMEYIRALLASRQQTQGPTYDSYGVETSPGNATPEGQHAGNMMGGRAMDPTQMQMLLRMFGSQ